MANKYWVGGTGTWSTTAGNWSTASAQTITASSTTTTLTITSGSVTLVTGAKVWDSTNAVVGTITTGGTGTSFALTTGVAKTSQKMTVALATAAVPVTTDIAIFDANSTTNGLAYTVTRTAITSVLGVQMDGNITFAGTAVLPISGSLAVGTLITSPLPNWTLTGVVTVTGTASTINSNSGITIASPITISGATTSITGSGIKTSATYTHTAGTNGCDNFSCGALIHTAGSISIVSGSIYCTTYQAIGTGAASLDTSIFYISGSASTVVNITNTNITSVVGYVFFVYTYPGASGTRTITTTSNNAGCIVHYFGANATDTVSITAASFLGGLWFTDVTTGTVFNGTFAGGAFTLDSTFSFDGAITIVGKPQLTWTNNGVITYIGTSSITQMALYTTVSGQYINLPITNAITIGTSTIAGNITFNTNLAQSLPTTYTINQFITSGVVTLTNGSIVSNNALICDSFATTSNTLTRSVDFSTTNLGLGLMTTGAIPLSLGTTKTNLTVVQNSLITLIQGGVAGITLTPSTVAPTATVPVSSYFDFTIYGLQTKHCTLDSYIEPTTSITLTANTTVITQSGLAVGIVTNTTTGSGAFAILMNTGTYSQSSQGMSAISGAISFSTTTTVLTTAVSQTISTGARIYQQTGGGSTYLFLGTVTTGGTGTTFVYSGTATTGSVAGYYSTQNFTAACSVYLATVDTSLLTLTTGSNVLTMETYGLRSIGKIASGGTTNLFLLNNSQSSVKAQYYIEQPSSYGTTLTAGNYFGNLSFINYTGTVAALTAVTTLCDSLTLCVGMAWTASTSALTFSSNVSGSLSNISTNGVVLDMPITFNSSSGYWYILTNLTLGNLSTSILTLTQGTLDDFANNITCGAFSSIGASTRQIVFSGGIWTLFNAVTAWNITGSGITTSLYSTAGKISLLNTSGTMTFAGLSLSYPGVSIDGAGVTGTITIFSGNNTFGSFSSTKPLAHTISFTSASTQTIGLWSVSGTAGNIVTINSTSTTAHNLVNNSLAVLGTFVNFSSDYLSLTNSHAS